MSDLVHSLGPVAPIVFGAFTVLALAGTLIQRRWLLEALVHRKIDKPGFVRADEDQDLASFQFQFLALRFGFWVGCVFVLAGIVLLAASLMEEVG